MTDVVQFEEGYKHVPTNPQEGQPQPEKQQEVAPEARLAELEKRFADTQAALTKANQELAAFKKPKDEQPAQKEGEKATPASEADKPKPENELEIKEAKAPDIAEVDATALQPFYEEYRQNQGISEESRDKIAQTILKGMKKEDAYALIDSYVEAARVRDAQTTQTLMSEAGGVQNYQTMVQWAAANLQEAEIKAYNSAVNSGDIQTASLAINGLRAKFERANGRVPQTTIQGNGAPLDGGVYKSMAEVAADQANPVYRARTAEGEAFRNKVRAKLARSKL